MLIKHIQAVYNGVNVGYFLPTNLDELTQLEDKIKELDKKNVRLNFYGKDSHIPYQSHPTNKQGGTVNEFLEIITQNIEDFKTSKDFLIELAKSLTKDKNLEIDTIFDDSFVLKSSLLNTAPSIITINKDFDEYVVDIFFEEETHTPTNLYLSVREVSKDSLEGLVNEVDKLFSGLKESIVKIQEFGKEYGSK